MNRYLRDPIVLIIYLYSVIICCILSTFSQVLCRFLSILNAGCLHFILRRAFIFVVEVIDFAAPISEDK